MIPRWKRSWPDLSENLPVDVLPCSNGEFYPKEPSPEQIAIMELANQESERWRRKMGMSRRNFVRTAAAMTIGFWAINQVQRGKWGYYAPAEHTATTGACDLENTYKGFSDPTTLYNLPGEFIFDVQSHHVESDGMWRVTNPAFEAFFAAIWSQAGPVTGDKPGIRSGGNLTPGDKNFIVRGGGSGELDPIESLSRYHYLKELFLDSATTMTVLSAVPAAPDITQPLPIDRAALTVQTVNDLAGTQRTVMHAFVMPNRGSAGTVTSQLGQAPVYQGREFEIMEERAIQYGGMIRGWKTYPAWGDIPYASGWFFDDPLIGGALIEQVRNISAKYPKIPPNIATHKGFALPGFDQRAASPRDIGPAASANPDVNFIVYHSGYDGETVTAYGGAVPGNTSATDAANGDRTVNSADRTVSSLIKSLREHNWDASQFTGSKNLPGSTGSFGNVTNVFAEIGSTWRSVMNNPDEAVHLLGKLIKYVGPRRIAWGTDALWFGTPQAEIVAMRKLQFTDAAKAFYNLPYGIDGDRFDPSKPTVTAPGHENDPNASPAENSIRNGIFGYNAAEVYKVTDAAAHVNDRNEKFNPTGVPGGMDCNQVQKIRDAYILNQATPKEMAPMKSNVLFGARTKRALVKQRKESPWAP
ncbi:MAG: amidohydrolase family protein [Actinomycetota bacterium]